jgi:GT2 family glycosyltransferase
MAEMAGCPGRVLDLGSRRPELGRLLKERGSEVIGVTSDPASAALFEGHYDSVLIADLDDDDLFERLGAVRFDAVVLDGSLGLVRQPGPFLQRVGAAIGETGFVLLCVPNVAHGAVRLALLDGRFLPCDGRAWDGTLRFYTRGLLTDVLEQADLRVSDWRDVNAGLFDTAIDLDSGAFPPQLVQALQEDEEATATAFVVKAARHGDAAPHGFRAGARSSLLGHRWPEAPQLTGALVNSVAALAAVISESAPKSLPPFGVDYIYRPDAAQDVATYRAWLAANVPVRNARRHHNLERLQVSAAAPTISVLVPVYRPDLDLLRRCVDSVLRQDYQRWQLCLCDDGSGQRHLDRLLDELEEADSRITVVRKAENGGISAATNGAAGRATGEFLAFLDQDDELEPGALADVALALTEDPDADIVYTDEDKLEPDGNRSEPFFKPDWCPDQLLSHMYMGHLLVVRRSLFDELGGLRTELDGSQDYDLALRATERARRVAHVPVVAYHWRKVPGSTAQEYRAKPGADLAARAALQEAMERRGEEATVESGLHEATFRVRRVVRNSPLVSVIIPFHNGAEDLRRCVTSLQTHAGYERWEAVLVDNRSWEPETKAMVARLVQDYRCRVLPYPEHFNWAALNNYAASRTEGNHLLFLNADVEGTSQGWLAAMLEHSQREEVGGVGARLVYPDGRIQHAGVVTGLGAGVAWHAFNYCPPEHAGYFGQAKLIRNYSAVTGACMMVRRQAFDEMGGFDAGLPIAYNDIDFCLRLRQRGYLVVYTPYAELVHEESAARGRSSQELLETAAMFERWEPQIRRDPYFNHNLDPRRSEFVLPPGREEVDPWESLVSAVERWSKRSGGRLPPTKSSTSKVRSARRRTSSR